MREPTNDEIAEMARAACDAARAKCDEFGLEWFFFMEGIARAYDSIEKTCEIFNAIGMKGTIKLGEALQKSQAYDMLKEAEEAINGD